jgi:hypothetical protein
VVTVTATNGANGIAITGPVPTLVPDGLARFAVRLDPSAFAADKFDLKVEKGLLASAKSDNFDKSEEIAKTIVQIAADGLKIAAVRSGAARAGSPRAASWSTDSVILDPFSGSGSRGCGLGSVPQARAVGCLSGLQVIATDLDGAPLPTYSRRQLEEIARGCEGSLCSRLLRPVRIGIRLGGVVASEHIVMLPDPGMVVAHDVRRGPCIQRITTLTFQTGVLERYELDKPSEVLGCLKVPLVVLQEIAKIPAALLTFRVEQVTNENKLLEAQKAQLDALMALAKAQADLAGSAQPVETRSSDALQRISQLESELARTRSNQGSRLDAEQRAASERCATAADPDACLRTYQSCRGKSHDVCLRQIP